jgi:hypothetical protein
VEVTHAKQSPRRRRGASLDGGDRRVDLERFGNRDDTLGAERVAPQAAKRGGNKIGVIGMLLPSECCYRRKRNDRNVVTVAVTKKANIKVEVTHAKERQRRRKGASLDVRDRRVDLERLGDCDATLGAEFGVKQAAKRGGNKKGMIGMLLPSR